MHTVAINTTEPFAPDDAGQDMTRSAVEVSLGTVGFDAFYRREHPGLLAVATALSGADGEDLVHDAMVRASMHWTSVSRLERPGGWAHRVLVNRCRSWWKRTRTEAAFLGRQRRREIGAPELAAETIAFWTAVRQLPTRPRLAVTLFYAADRTTAEVASILDVPEGTERSGLSRAREALARELEM